MPSYWAWLLLCVTILAMCSGASGSVASCRRSNCQFDVTDDCQHSADVDCNLEKQPIKRINITKKSFPASVQQITISNADEIEIQAEAVASLANLRSITLKHVNTVHLLPWSMARDNQSGSISLKIQDVKSLQLDPDTFSGWQYPGSSINMQEVEKCHSEQLAVPSDSAVRVLELEQISFLTIDTGAFSPNSSVQTVLLKAVNTLSIHSGAFAMNFSVQSVKLEDISLLSVDPGGFDANITDLTLTNVNMETCENTFRGHIVAMSLISSRINVSEEGCVTANNGWEHFLVQGSKINRIESSAIQGEIKSVQIKHSDIGTVEAAGFTLNVSRFSMEEDIIGDLSEDSLAVTAEESITLQRCDVGTLRENALRLLQATNNAKRSIDVKCMTLTHAENGSFQFAEGEEMSLEEIKLGAPCTCNMRELVKALGMEDQIQPMSGNGSQEENGETTPLIFTKIRCMDNTTTPTLVEYHHLSCPDPTTTTPTTTTTTATTTASSVATAEHTAVSPFVPVRGARSMLREHEETKVTQAGGVNSWILPVTVAAAVLMLVTAALLTIYRHCGHKFSKRQDGTDSRPGLLIGNPYDCQHLTGTDAEGMPTGISSQHSSSQHSTEADDVANAELAEPESSPVRQESIRAQQAKNPTERANSRARQVSASSETASVILEQASASRRWPSTQAQCEAAPLHEYHSLAQYCDEARPVGQYVDEGYETLPSEESLTHNPPKPLLTSVAMERSPRRGRKQARNKYGKQHLVPGFPLDRIKDPAVQQMARCKPSSRLFDNLS